MYYVNCKIEIDDLRNCELICKYIKRKGGVILNSGRVYARSDFSSVSAREARLDKIFGKLCVCGPIMIGKLFKSMKCGGEYSLSYKSFQRDVSLLVLHGRVKVLEYDGKFNTKLLGVV